MMASDYASIRAENERKYGTDIGRIGRMLLADRYGDRTHFIFELLQNAEDALARRIDWQGSRAVNFHLSTSALRITHCGQPFDDRDVQGICGIAESTKDLTEIGRFGIGFKSVYAFTDRPEVHSGDENFAIESYVWPIGISAINRPDDETVFILTLGEEEAGTHTEIAEGLRRLGPRTLLFLRQIDEIAWNVEGGPSGLYMRSKPEAVGENARQIVLIGEEHGKPDVEETWLVFSREARTFEGALAGHVEIAFLISPTVDPGRFSIQPLSDSRLVVFFPTVVPTHLGFLLQGPYRTTPSRDNVPSYDSWNQHLTMETSMLLVEALHWLRAQGWLDVEALRSLPLDRTKFSEDNMFAPLFERVREALLTEALLPAFGGGYASANTTKLGRTQELRDLFNSRQLANIFNSDVDMSWLSSDITQDRTPELRQYLIHELNIMEVTPDSVLSKLDLRFFKVQPDDWMRKFYDFLSGQPALLRQGRLGSLPLIRLEDGSQVAATINGKPQAFLPGETETDFPTVRRSICTTKEAQAFLQALGLTKPDSVDDVIRNILPRYQNHKVEVSDTNYEADIRRILAAFATDSKGQREKLIRSLRNTAFVLAVDAGDGSKKMSKPIDLYLATDRLKDLFKDVANVLIVDDTCPCLRGEDVRELLEASGASRYLKPIPFEPNFTYDMQREMRRNAGQEISSGINDKFEDWSLSGIDSLLVAMRTLPAEKASKKAEVLWEALADVETRRGQSSFSGIYRWTYYGNYSCEYPSAFVRMLNDTAWVPDANGDLQQPEFILFDMLNWKPNPFLLSKILFKPPLIEALAREVGIEPGVLDLLKQLGVTNEAELRSRLGIEKQPPDTPAPVDVVPAGPHVQGEPPVPPPVPAPLGTEPASSTGGGGIDGGVGTDTEDGTQTGPTPNGHRDTQPASSGNKRIPSGPGGRPFISYIGVYPDDEESDPDGLDHQARMELENKAIEFILQTEPHLHRTPAFNPGYDLFEAGNNKQPIRWIEVKSMTGGLQDRAVGLSRTQFECAYKFGEAYWLYIVEHASDLDAITLLRIQDPAGKVRTFTFDRGWRDIAEVVGLDADEVNQEE
jgi:hypothetical protein